MRDEDEVKEDMIQRMRTATMEEVIMQDPSLWMQGELQDPSLQELGNVAAIIIISFCVTGSGNEIASSSIFST